MKFKSLIVVLLVAFAVFPVLAQEDTTNSVSFNGFSMSFDSSLASSVNISQMPGDPIDSPFVPEVAHTQFLFYNEYPAPESFLDANGAVRVYRTADLAGNESRESQLVNLQALLSQRADLTPNMVMDAGAMNALPFLPVFPAGQIIRARAQYVETAQVSGVAYLTVFREDTGPFIASEILYTFQGLSADGSYYISAIFHANPAMLPTEYPVIDPTTFDMTAYGNDIIAQLNAAAPEDFSPSLTTLDTVIQSFSFAH
ncbi:MAG: hypothetical protein U0694_16050 [Anaerolineae bacterium]